MSSQHWQDQPNLFGSTPDAGGMLVWLAEQGGRLPGGSWTADISECPNDADVCTRPSLSEILLRIGPDEPYWLSPKACAGILQRATRRGKQLPSALHRALTERATLQSC